MRCCLMIKNGHFMINMVKLELRVQSEDLAHIRQIHLIYLKPSLGRAWVLSLVLIKLVLEHVAEAMSLRVKTYEKEFELSHLETCEACMGTGAKVGSKMRICSTCGGRGQVMRTEQTPFGLFSQVSVCPNCGGNGEVISEFCRKCSGEGRIRVKKDIKLKVPPGVSKGSVLRIVGEGDAGPKGGISGDLYVYLDVEEIPEIQRDGVNLRSTVPISYLEAILGAVVKVKTVEGVSDLQIPPGTQPGDVLVLAKKGVPKLNKPSIRGDHLFTIKVTIPSRISTKERELLEELALLSTTTPDRSRTRMKAPPTPKETDNETDDDATVPIEDSVNETDFWKKLKDFVGSVANGAITWFKDNL
uniref:CR-type domain-containing protein n=1 Tax=Kalanchoe fedtschenkoi TaxID=63787 RepID=A0A7N0TPM7_KALFE